MNKRAVYLILLLLLIAVAAYFYFSDQTTTLKGEYSDFAITDTASVDRIFIADYNGQTADLKRREDGTWTINDNYLVRSDAVRLLLQTFHDIEVREPVARSAFETVVKELAVRSTKVEVYKGGKKPDKVYYVGHATKSHYGTNMLLEVDGKKSTVPFVMHIPGFFGYLSTRFFTEEDLWRDRSVFDVDQHNIAEVKIAYLENPLKSFRLRQQQDGFEVVDLQQERVLDPLYKDAITEYLGRFGTIHFEMIDNVSDQATIDSVLASPPLHRIEVTRNDGKTFLLKTYYKPVTDGTINPATGEEFTYNVDRLFGYINDTDFVLLQWPTLDKILAYYEDFRMPENVNK